MRNCGFFGRQGIAFGNGMYVYDSYFVTTFEPSDHARLLSVCSATAAPTGGQFERCWLNLTRQPHPGRFPGRCACMATSVRFGTGRLSGITLKAMWALCVYAGT